MCIPAAWHAIETGIKAAHCYKRRRQFPVGKNGSLTFGKNVNPLADCPKIYHS